jgi:hypothetical protein
VKRVEKGFRHFKEINTVYYDPAVITIEEMEIALKKAGTYVGPVKWFKRHYSQYTVKFAHIGEHYDLSYMKHVK